MMAYVGTKGYYVALLKQHGVRRIDGKKLESFKTHVLANLYNKIKKA